jgi:xylan 1,4-beta-xylosidase
MAVTDENGWRYLVWKEGGNSRNLPTPIWAQRLSRDGLKLIGSRTELIRNDAPWEAKVVEAPFICGAVAGSTCSIPAMTAAVLSVIMHWVVARSPYLRGPWEKNPANPILKGDETGKCPGRGSIVTDAQGRDYLLYHAYQKDSLYVGRQALLDEVKWDANQWPTIANGTVPSGLALSPHGNGKRNTEYSFVDDFTSPRLMAGWQWPHANAPSTRIEQARRGWLALSPASARAHDVIGAIVARSTVSGPMWRRLSLIQEV